MKRKLVKFSQLASLTLVAFGLLAPPSFAAEYWLCAQSVNKMMPDSTMVPMWGFAMDDNGNLGDGCPAASATVPGPKLTVPSTETTLTIHLRNDLTGPGIEPVSIVIPGQAMPTASPPVFNGNRVRSFVQEAATSGGTQTYSWSNLQAGSYLYESGTHPQVQVQMGLYGAVTKDSAAGMAYSGVPYTQQRDLFYSEVDPALHAAVDDGSYGTTGPTSTLNYQPKYFLLHGYDSVTNLPVDVSIDTGGTIPPTCIDSGIVDHGDPLLLRLYNAGLRELAPMLLGAHFDLVAEGGKKYLFARTQYQTLLMPGSTKDAVFTPAYAGTFPIVERRLNLTDAAESGGGMQTCLQVALAENPPTVNIVNPAQGSTVFGDMVAVQINASDVEDAAGTLTVTWDVDSGASQMATYNGVSGYYEATLDSTMLSDGAHTINASVTDSAANTATATNVVVTVSNQPAVNIVAPADGATISGNAVLVQIDASDAEDDAGGAGSLSVMWDVDGGASQPTTYNGGTGYYEATLDSTALSDGAHTINASLTDSRGNLATDSNNVTVASAGTNTAPVVTITNPLTGATYTDVASIPFTGTASDAEDGDISGSLSWTSNMDGSIGSGGSFSSTLSLGMHTITASVTDSGGLPGSDSIMVNIIPATTDTLFCNRAAYRSGPDRMTIEVESSDNSGALTMTAVMDVAGDGFGGADDVALNAQPFTAQTLSVYRQVTNNFSGTYGVTPMSTSQVRVTSSLGGQCTSFVQAK